MIHRLTQQPVPVHCHRNSKKLFPVQTEPPALQFVPIASGPVKGHGFTPSFQVIIDIDATPVQAFSPPG